MNIGDIGKNHAHTLRAAYIGYVTQAIIVNFVPLLFVTFNSEFNIPLDKITLLITVNFSVQLLVDLISARYADKIGYRRMIMAAHIFAGVGLTGLALFPLFMPVYAGIFVSVIIYAIGGGIIEVLISPIVEACPTDQKTAHMSLLHAFYCWGVVITIIVSTLFFLAFGIKNWRILACLWAVVPFLNAAYFAKVPIYSLTESGESMPLKKLLSMKTFWIFILIMVCAGASEQSMIQWASAFAESTLHVSKAVGDLAGPCVFSIIMGIMRMSYSRFGERLNPKLCMIASCLVGIAGYALAATTGNAVAGLIGCALCGVGAGILWPGTFSVAADGIPKGGTAMFALLALAGDLGCSSGPTTVGLVASAAGNMKSGLLAAIVFPALMIVGLLFYKKPNKNV